MVNKKFTDLFIKRPVLASVIAIILFLVGFKSLFMLQLRQYPKVTSSVVTVSTSYPGASSELVESYITTILEKSVASAEGVDYIASESTQGSSKLRIYIRTNYPVEQAFNHVSSKVSEVVGSLPRSAEKPIVSDGTSASMSLLYAAFDSKNMNQMQITDYIAKVVVPKLQTINGVANVDILGGKDFAMRIWLDRAKLAGYGITVNDVVRALQEKNYLSSAGKTKGKYIALSVGAKTDLSKASEFKRIILRSTDKGVVRLEDVTKVELGASYYDSNVMFNGQQSVFIGVKATSTANPLTTIKLVRDKLIEMSDFYPAGLHSNTVYDATVYIQQSIHEVIKTIIEATIIVVLIILIFLGSFRSVLIPLVAIPLSIIGVCVFMLALGYTINLMTLLAMVLAIGMVVDDAIVVVENVFRHIEEGKKPFEAALQGAREIATPVIAMTITLVAVYAPIGFMGGLTGSLFKEFAFALAGAVVVSGFIALTLSPMMASRLLPEANKVGRYERFIEHVFDRLKGFYGRRLHNALRFRPVVLMVAIVVLAGCAFLYMGSKKEFIPQEDTGAVFGMISGPDYANHAYMTQYINQFQALFPKYKDVMAQNFMVNGMGKVNSGFFGMLLKPWHERNKTTNQVLAQIQGEASQIAGVRAMAFVFNSVPGASDFPISFVLTTMGEYKDLLGSARRLVDAANKSGMFMFVRSELSFTKPVYTYQIDRDKAADLGVSVESIGQTLGAAVSGAYLNRFAMDGSAYLVIPQLTDQGRRHVADLEKIYVRSDKGKLIQLSALLHETHTVGPNTRYRFQQLRSTTIQGMLMPGVGTGEALQFLRNKAKDLPGSISYNYDGSSRRFMKEGDALMWTFVFAIVIIYLVLSAQFESFRDPIIILFSVPMSIFGALLPIHLGLATINIYTQIGLVTLIGLISKHGILMVDYANKLRESTEMSIKEAIEESAKVRLRPILMTTLAMIFGVLPLLLAAGPGAHSRFDIGLVISCGMFIGTLFTLFVVPVMYTFLAERDRKPLD